MSRKCPSCAMNIPTGGTKCPYCHESISPGIAAEFWDWVSFGSMGTFRGWALICSFVVWFVVISNTSLMSYSGTLYIIALLSPVVIYRGSNYYVRKYTYLDEDIVDKILLGIGVAILIGIIGFILFLGSDFI